MSVMTRAMTLAPLGLIVIAGVHVRVEAFARVGQDPRPAAQASPSRAQRLIKERDNVELQKVPAFRLFDNLYYVGIGWVASYLMTTDQGLILIDTVHEPYVDHLIDGIKKFGFDPKGIKYALVTHAHFDHMGGAARIQEMTAPRWACWKEIGSCSLQAVRATCVHRAETSP